MSTVYFTRPDNYRGRRRRRSTSTHRVGLAVLGAIWLLGSTVGTLALTGVVR